MKGGGRFKHPAQPLAVTGTAIDTRRLHGQRQSHDSDRASRRWAAQSSDETGAGSLTTSPSASQQPPSDASPSTRLSQECKSRGATTSSADGEGTPPTAKAPLAAQQRPPSNFVHQNRLSVGSYSSTRGRLFSTRASEGQLLLPTLYFDERAFGSTPPAVNRAFLPSYSAPQRMRGSVRGAPTRKLKAQRPACVRVFVDGAGLALIVTPQCAAQG